MFQNKLYRIRHQRCTGWIGTAPHVKPCGLPSPWNQTELSREVCNSTASYSSEAMLHVIAGCVPQHMQWSYNTRCTCFDVHLVRCQRQNRRWRRQVCRQDPWLAAAVQMAFVCAHATGRQLSLVRARLRRCAKCSLVYCVLTGLSWLYGRNEFPPPPPPLDGSCLCLNFDSLGSF